MKKKIIIVVSVLLVLCTCTAGYIIYGEQIKQDIELNKELDVAVESNYQLLKQVDLEKDNSLLDIDWEYLQGINQDIIAWVEIPNTYISFPVLQEQIIQEYYYLDHDYKKDKVNSGSIFTPAEPLGVKDAHFMLFGHHTKNKDVAFSGLQDLFDDKETASKHSLCFIYYPDYKYEIYWLKFANATTSDDQIYEIPYLLGTDSYQELLDHIENTCLYKVDDSIKNNTKTLILSTCNGRAGSNKRFYLTFELEQVVDYSYKKYEKERGELVETMD